MNSNLAYQDDFREELIGGKLVAMSPRPSANHNIVSDNIFTIFSVYLRGKICRPFSDGMALYLTEEDHFVPDMMVVCDRSKIKGNGVHGAPDLVAEVLSASTGRYDRGRKMEVYARCGVREYWIVSTAERSVEQYLLRGGQLTLHAVYALQPDYMLDVMTEAEKADLVTEFRCSLFDDLVISLHDIFSDLLDP